MATIKTQRLQLLALNKTQHQLYSNNTILLAKVLGLVPVELAVEPGFWEEVPDFIEKMCLHGVEAHPEQYEWHSRHFKIIM